MATTVRAKVGVTLTLTKRVVTVYEDDVLGDLRYNNLGTETVISGRIRAIVADTRANNNTSNSCPPEPYVERYITPRMLIIDSSDEYDAEMIRVNISDIIDIVTINDVTDPETIVDQAIETMSDRTVTENENNDYNVEVHSGTITSKGLFEAISEIDGFESLVVTSGDQTFTYKKSEDLEAYKARIDAILPKKNGDPDVTLVLTINFNET